MDFLSSNLPLILFFLTGFGLMLVEAFMPGFGIAGVLGIILEVLAIYSCWVGYGVAPALILTLVILALTGLTIFFSYRSAMKGRLSKSALILKDEENPEKNQVHQALNAFTGKEGVSATSLRPAGQVEVDGKRMSASTGGVFLERGVRVCVVGVEGDHLLVRPAPDAVQA